MPSRKLEDLTPSLRQQAEEFLRQANLKLCPLTVKVIQTLRTKEEQTAYYAQGRYPLDEVNRLRTIAGLSFITRQENNIVTRTMQSFHLPGPDGLSHAFDIGIFDGNTYLAGKDALTYYIQCAEIGKNLGLVCGAFWNHPDYPHYQLYDVRV